MNRQHQKALEEESSWEEALSTEEKGALKSEKQLSHQDAKAPI
jgi:hypothetical protein